MDRRHFLRAGIISTGGAVALPVVASAAGAQIAEGPYGSLEGIAPDANGIVLPPGFHSRVAAVAGETVGDTDYEWLIFPDGAATFDDGEGGWFHTVNSEIFNPPGLAGVSAIHYGPDGEILDAYRILEGSVANCGGGPTPWGTFLSGEEAFFSPPGTGLMWECDPTGATPAMAHPAMGLFVHEAAAVDPDRKQVYMTEDRPNGRLYRFTPTNYPDLSEGLLEVAKVDDEGSVTWLEVPDPSAAETVTREQISPEDSTVFNGGEGIWYHDDWIFFSTKGDNVIHAINTATSSYERVYEADPSEVADGTAVLSGVDNLTVDSGSGDIYVAEDGGNMEIVVITPEGDVAPFLRVIDQVGSEITGPVFNPRRDRLYFSSQRGPTPRPIEDVLPALGLNGPFGGVTYEISGPFRGVQEDPPEETTTSTTSTTTTTTEAAVTTTTASPVTTLANATADSESGNDGSSNTGLLVGAGVVVALAGGGLAALRNRRATA